MPALRPYSRPDALSNLDGRTKEARLMRETRRDLIAHIGGHPSATERALIERIVQLTVRVATMDRKFTETGEMTELDSRTYLAWSAHLTRAMQTLGLKGAPQRPLSAMEHIAALKAARAPAA